MWLSRSTFNVVIGVTGILVARGPTVALGTTPDVSPDPPSAVVVDLQLSPPTVTGPLTRCICFDLYHDCNYGQSQVCQEISFTNGFAGGVTIPIPPDCYGCVEAADLLHTLRSLSGLTLDGTQYSARFAGDPAEGGNWLIGGNLDFLAPWRSPYVIDILDEGVFMSQVGVCYGTGDSTCQTPFPHADINGDGWVDSLDKDITGCCTGFDTDGDGVPDWWDECPDDPDKIYPGICGCGIPDTDSDGDGYPDCIDQCPGVDDDIFAPEYEEAIPTVSAWGLIILTLLLLTTAKIVLTRWQTPGAHR